MLWKDLFPTREEYAARGGPYINPPGGENPPPKGTQVIIGGKIYEYTGAPAGIMPRLVGDVPPPPSSPVQRCPTCGQNIMPKPTPVPMNTGGQLRRFL